MFVYIRKIYPEHFIPAFMKPFTYSRLTLKARFSPVNIKKIFRRVFAYYIPLRRVIPIPRIPVSGLAFKKPDQRNCVHPLLQHISVIPESPVLFVSWFAPQSLFTWLFINFILCKLRDKPRPPPFSLARGRPWLNPPDPGSQTPRNRKTREYSLPVLPWSSLYL